MKVQHTSCITIILLAWSWGTTGLEHKQMMGTNQLAEHDSDVQSRIELKIPQPHTHQQNIHLLSPQLASPNEPQERFDNQTVNITVALKEASYNVTLYQVQLRQLWSLRKLKIQGQYAYISIVFLICLTLAGLQCMGGLGRRHRRSSSVPMGDDAHFVTIKELLSIKAKYLPICHQNCELKEVLVHDCGNDP
ncbi:unnamed protein product [Candidula unifasciata]|uniref:Uncharacterized protein n=1 Tax=Candidula unifasciata TaxID=100452 RepID=A0A8S3YP75_9EUPU|nr:unnamed protein product [Candidula unifasciata]